MRKTIGAKTLLTRLLPRFGAVAGRRVAGRSDLYRVDTVIEKPTPTEAEQRLLVPGLRAGYYLCFFGMHVLTPRVMEILGKGAGTLSAAVDRRNRFTRSSLFCPRCSMRHMKSSIWIFTPGRSFRMSALTSTRAILPGR